MPNSVKPQADISIAEKRAAKADQKIQNLIRDKEGKYYRDRSRANLAAGKIDKWKLINDPIKIQKYGEQQPTNGQLVANDSSPNGLKDGLYESDDYPGTIFKVDENENFKIIANPTPEALINFAHAKGMTSIEVDADVPQNANGDWLEEWWQKFLAGIALKNLETAMKQGQEQDPAIKVTISSRLKSLIDKDPKLAIKFDALQKANQAAHKEAKQLYPLKKSRTFNDLDHGLQELNADTQTEQQIRANSGNTLDEKMEYLAERINKKKTEQDLINKSCKELSNDVKNTELNDPDSKFTAQVKKDRMLCKDSRDDLTNSLKQSQENVEKELKALKTVLTEVKAGTQDQAQIKKLDELEKQIDSIEKENKSTQIIKLEKEGNELDELLEISSTPAPQQDQDQNAAPRPGRS